MGVPAIPAVTYRSVTADGRVTMRVAMSLLTGESGSWSDIALAEGDGVPWTVTEPWGAYQGVAALEDCVGCPNLQLTYPHMPFLAAWVDQRSGAGSQIWMRRFPFGN